MPFFLSSTLVSMVRTTAFFAAWRPHFHTKTSQKKFEIFFIIDFTLMHTVFFKSKCKHTDRLFISIQFQSF